MLHLFFDHPGRFCVAGVILDATGESVLGRLLATALTTCGSVFAVYTPLAWQLSGDFTH